MNSFVEKERLFKELYDNAIKNVNDGWCYVQDAQMNNYTETTIDSEAVEKVLKPYNGAVDAWKRFLEKSKYSGERNIYSAMYELHILPAIAVAVAIRVFVCPEVEIMLECESSKYSDGEIDYWWGISSIEPNGIEMDSKAKYKKYLARLRKVESCEESEVSSLAKETTTKAKTENTSKSANKEKNPAKGGKRVTIDKNWSIKLPEKFIHSTKCFMTEFSAIYDDGSASLSDTSNASCCFEVCNIIEYTNSDVDYTIPWATRLVTNGTIAQIGSSDVLMATKHVLVCYNKPEWDDFAKKDRYIINLLVDRKYYFLQFYIGECEDLGLRNKKDKDKFVFDMLKTIRYVGEGNIDYDKINCAKAYTLEPLSEEEYQAEYKEAVRSIMGDMFSEALGVPVTVGCTDEDDENEDGDDFDPVAAEKAKAEIVDALSDISASLDSMLEKTKILEEEARQREQAEIDEATKRGKYIPIEFKPNNIFSKEFAELLEQGKPYPKYSENDFETFVRRVKEIIASDISDVPEDVLYIEVLGWYTDSVEYNSEKIVKLWNNYLRSLKGEETDFSTWQIDLWGISACDAIDAALFELDNKFWLNGFVSEDEDFEIDAKGLLKKYNGTASNIVLPEGVTQFASGKFYNSNKKISNVTSFTLPSSLKKLDIQSEVPFPKMKNLSRVDVSADNEVFSSVDGVLLSKDGTELIYYPVAKRAEEYKVPATVTKIRSGAFARNHYIKKLIISGNVVDTGENNFCNCTSLVTVIFENGVKIIGKNSFAECTSLQEVFVSESVEKLLMTTFDKCAGIKTIYACEGSKAIVNAEKLSTKLGAKLIVCKPGQVYDDVSLKPQKKETKTVDKSVIKSAKSVQTNTQPQQSTTKVKSQSKANNGTVSAPPPVVEKTAEQSKKSGCYVATAVYGSYDCPEVWTLRRFRDYSLAATLLGRLFIMLYYTISPTLVKWFGNTKWFKKIWKALLDKMVEKLQRNGFENTPYQDRNY